MFAQRTFADETDRITSGAAGWQEPAEMRLETVTSDGFLVVHEPHRLVQLASPWPLAKAHGEVMIELKLPGNHLDRIAVEKALLRRKARQLERVEQAPDWRGDEPLWLVAPHVPRWLREFRSLTNAAQGCYWVGEPWRCFLWIAANELPLQDALIPFLLARSGPALDQFAQWVAPKKSINWVLSMLEYLPMSTLTHDDLMWRFGKSEDPEVEARRQRILQFLLKTSPETQQELRDEGHKAGHKAGHKEGALIALRDALRQVLADRQLRLNASQAAQIEACVDLETLKRWHRRAITAASAADALT